jgi:hypothetical protein
MIYRVIRRLATGKDLSTYIEIGSTIKGTRFKPEVTTRLCQVGALAPVSAPPLEILPGWKLRSKRFNDAGYDAITALEATDEDLAAATGYHVRSIRKWKKELESFLGIGDVRITEGCVGCGQK